MTSTRKTTRMMAISTAFVVLLVSTESLGAHHSLVDFDTSAPIWVKGKVLRVEVVNPHSRIYLEQTDENGTQEWVADGPSPLRFKRMGLAGDRLKVGDVVEICGFESRWSQDAFRHGHLYSKAWKLPGRLMNGNLLVLPDGEKKVLSNYGELYQCLGPEDRNLLKQ